MRIFVTGASSGIGRSLVLQLVDEGHQVWGVGRRKCSLAGLEKIKDNPNFRYEECDIEKNESNADVLQKMHDAGFMPDVVVLNAAIGKNDANKLRRCILLGESIYRTLPEAWRWPIYCHILDILPLARCQKCFLLCFQGRAFHAISRLARALPRFGLGF